MCLAGIEGRAGWRRRGRGGLLGRQRAGDHRPPGGNAHSGKNPARTSAGHLWALSTTRRNRFQCSEASIITQPPRGRTRELARRRTRNLSDSRMSPGHIVASWKSLRRRSRSTGDDRDGSVSVAISALAWRRLRAAPALSIFAVVTLALGVGATTAIYSVVRTALGSPPGVADAGRVLDVFRMPRGSLPMVGLSWPDYQEFRQRQTAFDKVAAGAPSSRRSRPSAYPARDGVKWSTATISTSWVCRRCSAEC